MTKHDLFELTKLPFDFSEKDSKEHEKAVVAIKNKIKAINGEINNVSDKASFIAQRDFLKGLLENDEKDLKLNEYERLKKEKTHSVMEAFKANVKVMAKQTVAEQYVQSWCEKTKLSEQSIRSILKSLDIEVIKFEIKIPEFPESTRMREIEKELGNLRRFGEVNSEYFDLKHVNDMYDFVAYLERNIIDSNEYHDKRFNELNTILASYTKSNSGHQAPPVDICVRIAAPASTMLFNSEENKEKYDNYLLYNSLKMNELKSQIKALPDDALKSPEFADNIIMEIEQIFNDKNYALSIYNHEAGFGKKKEPYIQQSIKFYLKCGHCGSNLAFVTREEQDKAEKCKNCNEELYKQCKKCNEEVLVALDKCPKCRFALDGAAEFAKHITRADEARRKGSFEEARQHLFRAQTADPGEKTIISELEGKIAADEAKYQKPINELKQLITGKMFQAASEALIKTIKDFPMLNVSYFEAEIKSVLSKAQMAFNSVKKSNPSGMPDICTDILNYCTDFKPALQYFAEEFLKQIDKADEARRKGNFEEARQHLSRAQKAAPGEKARISELEGKIAADEVRCQKPLNELHQLIADKKFQTASETLIQAVREFPMLNLSSFETEIKSALSKAQTTLDSTKNLSPRERADACIDILDCCVDFIPALQYLNTTQPQAVKGLNISIDSIKCNATLNWARSSEKRVTYRIIRKIGKDIPKNERDGELLKDDIADTLYYDENILPGVYYSYVVFAKRMNIYSLPAGSTILLLADVMDLRYEQLDTTLRITWNIPQNCSGVKISRRHEGKESVLTENAHGSFEDKNIEYNKSYSYTLKANYFDLPSSNGIDFNVIILPKIEHFKMSASQIKDNKYKIAWDIKRNDFDIRILVNKKTVRELKSDRKDCEIELPKDGFHNVEVAAFSGGNWLASQNNVEINTYTSCEIDKALSQIREKRTAGANSNIYSVEFSIKFSGSIPHNTVAFWYVVRTKSASSKSAPWVDADEIVSARDVFKIPVAVYKEKGELVYTASAKDEDVYYVTIFTVYNVNGKDVISAPCKRKFERPLEADIFWKVSKPIIGKCKLFIEIRPNRPITRQPKLILCACSQDAHLLSHTDAKAQLLMEIEEMELDSPQNIYKQNFEIFSSTITNKNKLFLFEVSSAVNEKYSLRWANGFSGKVKVILWLNLLAPIVSKITLLKK